jgi:hypothetical protein
MNTRTSNPIEDEINAIRIKLYEQTKDMTTDERVAFFNDRAKEGLAKHGIKARYVTAPVVRRQVQPLQHIKRGRESFH